MHKGSPSAVEASHAHVAPSNGKATQTSNYRRWPAPSRIESDHRRDPDRHPSPHWGPPGLDSGTQASHDHRTGCAPITSSGKNAHGRDVSAHPQTRGPNYFIARIIATICSFVTSKYIPS